MLLISIKAIHSNLINMDSYSNYNIKYLIYTFKYIKDQKEMVFFCAVLH